MYLLVYIMKLHLYVRLFLGLKSGQMRPVPLAVTYLVERLGKAVVTYWQCPKLVAPWHGR